MLEDNNVQQITWPPPLAPPLIDPKFIFWQALSNLVHKGRKKSSILNNGVKTKLMIEKYYFWFLPIHKGRTKLSTEFIWLKNRLLKFLAFLMWHLFKGRVYWRLTLRVSFFCRGKIIIVTVWMVLKTKVKYRIYLIKKPFVKIFSVSNVAFIQGQSLLEVDVTCLLFLPW